ncbi:hypothetical protein B0H17DRAFT_1129462 [Mycena rosella]|uniref:Uncharacterized protein n=1 Tax=Mycena rosella TaxID=1033263 RepID=A0AAD7DTY2_MYCRO|nr:hypothetical protein B0H17DRAFT_1129462 [Mycena rosella]
MSLLPNSFFLPTQEYHPIICRVCRTLYREFLQYLRLLQCQGRWEQMVNAENIEQAWALSSGGSGFWSGCKIPAGPRHISLAGGLWRWDEERAQAALAEGHWYAAYFKEVHPESENAALRLIAHYRIYLRSVEQRCLEGLAVIAPSSSVVQISEIVAREHEE